MAVLLEKAHEKAKGFIVPKLVAQCTFGLLWARTCHRQCWLVVFQQCSGMLLVNLVISGGKIAAVFVLREFIWGSGVGM